MRLADALRVDQKRVIAFTGAGGKSTAIDRLTKEISVSSPVVVTTTTKLHRNQSSIAEAHLIAQNPGELSRLSTLLGKHTSVLVTGEVVEGESKWLGLDQSTSEALHTITKTAGAVLLIEADGARGCSLKAPAEHEPVIPAYVDLVVPVVGLDVVGAALNGKWVHRPELVASLLGLTMGDRLGLDHVASLVSDPSGGLKGVPQNVEVRVLLNKAETPDRIAEGGKIAGRILASPRISAAVLASVTKPNPVEVVVGRVAGVVLAAGDSRRLGQPKQLVNWRGRPLVWHAVQAALGGGLSPVVVVIGAEAKSVRQVLAGERVIFVENPEWADGMSTSLNAGLAEVEEHAEAVVLLLSDMPLVDEALVSALVKEHRRTLSPLVAPRAGGRRANPVLFDRVTFPALHAVQGDHGGRGLFQLFSKVWIEWDESILFDLDSPEDLRRLRELE